MRPVKSAERNMNPSAAETNPNGWLTYVLRTVGRCIRVIHTSISPRRASSSFKRRMGSQYEMISHHLRFRAVIKSLLFFVKKGQEYYQRSFNTGRRTLRSGNACRGDRTRYATGTS